MMATGRLAAAMAVAVLTMTATPHAAQAQAGLPSVVMMVTYQIPPEQHDDFRAWIAEFRTLVEKQIAEGRLSQTDMCAYKSWRVLGPDAAGLNQNFIFVFEPVIPIANYLLQHYVDQALDKDAARAMMTRWSLMNTHTPTVTYASPLNPAVDAIDLGAVCEF